MHQTVIFDAAIGKLAELEAAAAVLQLLLAAVFVALEVFVAVAVFAMLPVEIFAVLLLPVVVSKPPDA